MNQESRYKLVGPSVQGLTMLAEIKVLAKAMLSSEAQGPLPSSLVIGEFSYLQL